MHYEGAVNVKRCPFLYTLLCSKAVFRFTWCVAQQIRMPHLGPEGCRFKPQPQHSDFITELLPKAFNPQLKTKNKCYQEKIWAFHNFQLSQVSRHMEKKTPKELAVELNPFTGGLIQGQTTDFKNSVAELCAFQPKQSISERT